MVCRYEHDWELIDASQCAWPLVTAKATASTSLSLAASAGTGSFPSLVEHAFFGEIRHPPPEWSRGKANAIVVVALNLFNQDATQTLGESAAGQCSSACDLPEWQIRQPGLHPRPIRHKLGWSRAEGSVSLQFRGLSDAITHTVVVELDETRA